MIDLIISNHIVFADVIWPALFLVWRLLFAVPLGLLIEFFFLWKLIGLNLKDAISADALMNLASTMLGFILIPLLGLIAIIPFPATFGTGAWIATFIVSVLINTFLESWIVKRWLKADFVTKDFWLLALANSLSVGVALCSFIF